MTLLANTAGLLLCLSIGGFEHCTVLNFRKTAVKDCLPRKNQAYGTLGRVMVGKGIKQA